MRQLLLFFLSSTLIFLVSCGGSGGGSGGIGTGTPSGNGDGDTSAIVDAVDGEWTLEDETIISGSTSTSTVRLSDDSYIMYLAGIRSATSTDGLTFENQSFLDGVADYTDNPAILLHSDGTYILIYEQEVVSDENLAAPVLGMKEEEGGSSTKYFLRSTASDGETFTQTTGSETGGAVFGPEDDDDPGPSVPDMIELSDESIRIYFVTGGSFIGSALSTDKGVTWEREGLITIKGLAEDRPAVDPDIIQLDDGRYRLFFVAPEDGVTGLYNLRILSAVSDDGLTFSLEEGERVSIENEFQFRVDPDVIQLPDGSYRMFFGEQDQDSNGYNLKSAVSP